MVIGVMKTTFRLPGNETLKGKRSASRSLTSRLQRRFRLAAAEIEAGANPQYLMLGIACVSDDGRHADRMLAKARDWLETNKFGLLVDWNIELIHV